MGLLHLYHGREFLGAGEGDILETVDVVRSGAARGDAGDLQEDDFVELESFSAMHGGHPDMVRVMLIAEDFVDKSSTFRRSLASSAESISIARSWSAFRLRATVAEFFASV